MPCNVKIRPGDKINVAGITIEVKRNGSAGKLWLSIDAPSEVKIEVSKQDRGGMLSNLRSALD